LDVDSIRKVGEVVIKDENDQYKTSFYYLKIKSAKKACLFLLSQ